ncbi:UNVERIFIED_CONTAM: hypothetical protein Sradi_0063000 [Sesamum radiatum]|uniref:Uncharacterized protein n=1 Tax=Sesamum radiatum TaxID=300843 RepID=A0AAW2WKJ2_SESRA
MEEHLHPARNSMGNTSNGVDRDNEMASATPLSNEFHPSQLKRVNRGRPPCSSHCSKQGHSSRQNVCGSCCIIKNRNLSIKSKIDKARCRFYIP